jgi:hypothetical protein
MKSILIFFICWMGLASVVDYFDVSGVWGMTYGVFACVMHNWLMQALESTHERA